MALAGQSWLHSVHPVQREPSIRMLPPVAVSAGHPSSRMHFLQRMHVPESTVIAPDGFVTAIQGDLKMIAFTPGLSAVRRTQATDAG